MCLLYNTCVTKTHNVGGTYWKRTANNQMMGSPSVKKVPSVRHIFITQHNDMKMTV